MSKTESKTITQYLDQDYREYAIYVVEERAIPSVIDGFKPTQRKVVFVANKVWKSNSEKPLKVFQLAGKVASDAHYHHGESGVNGAITGMAQSFKNSMPVLEAIGQFGSLRSPEAGAPRYISTRLHPNFRLLYKDFELLESRWEEGCEIEPKFFLPIIPTVLLNGGSGIAVGFATNILNRHPVELIDACLKSLDGKKYKEPSPWFNGFSGTCTQVENSEKSWTFRGKYEIKNTSTLEISELPPSMTYEKFDSYLSDLEDSKRIVSYENNCKANISYTLKFRREDLKQLQDSGRLDRFLKMEEKQTENFTVIDENSRLRVFKSASEIVDHFVKFRLTYYARRKDYLIQEAEKDLSLFSNKAKFIRHIIDGLLKVNNVARQKVIEYLEANSFDLREGSYSYLLNLPIHTLTKEKYEELLAEISKKKKELDSIKQKEPIQMYKEDLLDLKKAVLKSL